ncbi:hypothetical protein BFP97_13130 [Roseivirga sp. 4D4]|uniref:hypothetical protein n=1 Tax=Roseivirga sp. 4D4 TaxID=1889784 RepID=UPI0008539ACF|nr:hypothetical protein [Roseivirga sp. 4D4]OEK02405.1 hypothetical protein BFP97_13130 [Roseivirga sp. 4D4]
MRSKVIFLSIGLMCLFSSSFGQKKSNVDPADLLNTYQNALPTEKVFLHLNKSEFGLGEIIWIKSYLVAGPMHLPSPISKTLYIELLNESGSVMKRLSVQSEEGTGQASLEIDDNWSQGAYYLRAYTNWMKNQDEEYFFKKKINIISPDLSEQFQPQQQTQELSVRFFPEGGNLVKDIQSWMAFEINGLSKTRIIKGKIFDQNDQFIQDFETSHEGRGKLRFLPRSESHYAIIESLSQKWPLPEAQQKGTIMTVNNTDPEEVIATFMTNSPGQYILHAHTRGISIYQSEIKLNRKKGRLTIPKNDLPEGITTLTLFDSNRRPIAERLIFINHQKGLNIQVASDKATYKKRELVKLDVTVLDAKGEPVEGQFSLTALNNKVSKNNQSEYNIRANQLLGSDLKGYLKQPAQYLGDSQEAQLKADLLMMVNGWRRFQWNAVLSTDSLSPEYSVEQGLTVKGRIYRDGKDLVKNGQVFMFTNVNANESKDLVITNEKGEFEFKNQVFTDTTVLTIQAFYKKGRKNINLTLDSISYEEVGWNPLLIEQEVIGTPEQITRFKEFMITNITVDTTYKRFGNVIALGDVIVEARDGREAELNRQIGIQGNALFLDDIPYEDKQSRDAYNIMMGRVPGFYLGFGAGEKIPMMGLGRRYSGPPAVFIDGRPVEFRDAYGLEATRIKAISATKDPPPGVIMIFTYTRAEYYAAKPKGPSYYSGTLPGYHVSREFYRPIYDGRDEPFRPDNRATMHWEPMITIDANGKASIEFYSSDDVTDIEIDIQGIGMNGTSGQGSAKIKVHDKY